MRLLFALSLFLSTYGFLSGQCLLDRHNTSLDAGWISCTTAESPNLNRGKGHWILYQMDDIVSIEEIQIWNINHPQALDFDTKDLAIDVSLDGETWEDLGTYELRIAPGSSVYEGEKLSNLPSFQAKYILLTSLTNYGANCNGLAEVKFIMNLETTSTEELAEEIKVRTYPNPFKDYIQISFDDPPAGKITFEMIDALGHIIFREHNTNAINNHLLTLKTKLSVDGQYYLRITTSEGTVVKKLSMIR